MRTHLKTAAALLAASAIASDVLSLTKSSFGDLISNEKLVLVEFFAPWCGHCKALAPEYEKAATELKNQSIKLAKVDCTAESDLCGEYNIQGYPTMKVFRDGQHSEYGGPRKSEGIISYMKKQSLPAVSIVSAENHTEFQTSDRIVLIAYLDASDETNKKHFEELAQAHRDEYLFGLSTDSASAAKVTAPALVMYKSFDEGRNDYSGAFSAEGFSEFISSNVTPLLDEITPENFGTYAETGLPLGYIFIEPENKEREQIIKDLQPVAREYKGKINFVWIDANKFVDHAKSLNLNEAKWPSFAIQDVAQMLKYPLSQAEAFTSRSVTAFVKDFIAGKIEPSIKSEPVPEHNNDPVTVLVASEFDALTSDKTKDYFVEFYAPWCGHCKKLAPTWESLGERYAAEKSKIMIAKFDAHNNDIPPSSDIKVQGFPTIKFRAAGSDEWVDYQGDRSLESFTDYITENSKTGAKPDETVSSTGSSEQIVMGHEEEEDMEDNIHDEL